MTEAATPIFRIEALEQHYGGRCVLRVPALKIEAGSIVGLMGPNGSGKSTLLRLLGFIEAPTRGRIAFKGAAAVPFDSRVRGKVTLLPQDPYLMRRTVYENVAYGLRIRKDIGPTRDKVYKALETVGLVPAVFARRPWYALSGGEAQRAALAARLVLEPEVLLMDEPTASVDAQSAEKIRQAALDARERWGTTLIIASHDWQWLFEVCDEMLHLHQGAVLPAGGGNILPGPWMPAAGGIWQRILADGQRLLAPAGSDPSKVAVIDADTLAVGPQNTSALEGTVILDGTVTRLFMIRRTARVLVTVTVADVNFLWVLEPAEVRARELLPGRSVQVGYHVADVCWR